VNSDVRSIRLPNPIMIIGKTVVNKIVVIDALDVKLTGVIWVTQSCLGIGRIVIDVVDPLKFVTATIKIVWHLLLACISLGSAR